MSLRMAQMLRLSTLNEHDSAIDEEVKKRISLSLFMADRWYSHALALPTQMQAHELPSAPAVDESVFQTQEYGKTLADCRPSYGLWAHKITIARSFDRIQQMIQHIVQAYPTEQYIDQQVELLAHDLLGWQQDLPSSMLPTQPNVDAYKAKQHGGTFIDLHLGYFFYATLLFFPFLGRPGSEPQHRHAYAYKCWEAALSYANLLALARNTPGCETVHATVGHMTVVSSAVLLHHFLSVSGIHDASVAREALVSNFAALMELQNLWPGLTKWVSILELHRQGTS